MDDFGGDRNAFQRKSVMIELSPITAFMLYLCLTLSMLLGLWIVHHYRSRSKKTLSSEAVFAVCEFCHFAYLDRETTKISQCPRCRSYNQREFCISDR